MKKLNLIRSPYILIICMALVTATLLCCKDDNKEEQKLSSNVTYDSKCKNSETKEFFGDSLTYRINGNTLFINKYNEDYCCGADSLSITTNITNDTLFITENWIGITNCMCPRDVEYNVSKIPKGNYVTCISILYHWYYPYYDSTQKSSDTTFCIHVN